MRMSLNNVTGVSVREFDVLTPDGAEKMLEVSVSSTDRTGNAQVFDLYCYPRLGTGIKVDFDTGVHVVAPA